MSAIIYLLQVSACLAIFYGFYYLMLNRLTFFTINRYYLLFTLVLSFIIPLLTIPVHQQYTAMPVMQQVINMRSAENIAVNIVPQATPLKTNTSITWMQLLNWSYIVAVAALFIHLLITLIAFFVKLRRRKISSIGSVHILRGDKNLPNGSFLNYIFLNDDELSAEEMEQIVAHEMLHVKLLHSADRILIKLVQIILWFNPFVYLYARSMEENHEFEVDREIARLNDKNKYAELLLHLSVANQGMLYHSFSKVPLKKRIVMLFNKPSAKVKRAVYILVLPVIVVSCLAFANIKKDDIKNFSLVKSTKKILNVIKAGQDNIVEQLNTPVPLPVALLTPDSIKIADKEVEPQPDGISLPAKDTIRYSDVVHISVPPSANIKVTIDNKQYPSDILYKISRRCIAASSLNINNDVIDVKLETKDGQLIYMTPHEKENLYLENKIAQLPFYNRRTLTYYNGVHYDFVSLNDTTHKKVSIGSTYRIDPDDKVGFLIDGKIYNEDEYKTLSQPIVAQLKRIGSAEYRPDMLYLNKYKVLYTLMSPGYVKIINPNVHGWAIKLNGGGGRSYSEVGSLLAKPDTPNIKFYKSLGVIGMPPDTIAYKTSAYKTDPNALLIELINKLPNLTTTDKGVFIDGKIITDLLINKKWFNGSVMQGLKSLPAADITEIQIFNANSKNPNRAVMNIISNPK